MKSLIAYILLLFASNTVCAQQLTPVDELFGRYGNIKDIDIDQNGTRFYFIDNAADSIVVNGNMIELQPSNPNHPFGRTYTISVDTLQAIPYNIALHKADQSTLTTTSRLTFTTFSSNSDDTLHVLDTFYTPTGPGSNLLLQETNLLSNERIKSKTWPSLHNCSFNVNDVHIKHGATYFCGEYGGNNGGMELDGHLLDIGTGNGNAFIGKIDTDNNVLWLKSVSGSGYQVENKFAINSKNQILLTGASASSFVYFCNDSLENQAAIDWGTDFLYFVQFDSLGNCTAKKTVDYIYGNIIPTSIGTLTDGAYIVSGDYLASYIGFDSLYLNNPNNDNTGFLIKLSGSLEALSTFQLGGSPGRKSIQSMIPDGSDNILICGYAESDTLMLGNTSLLNPSNNSTYGYFAILDANLKTVYGIKLETKLGQKLIMGKNGVAYLLVRLAVNHHILYKITQLPSGLPSDNAHSNDISLTIYPNPLTKGQQLRYELNGLNNETTVTAINAFDILGRKIATTAINNKQGTINLVDATAVIFVSFVLDNKTIVTKRVIIEY